MIQAIPSVRRGPGPLGVRLAAAAVVAAGLGLLVTAASLDASPAGMGTHTQLGLAACGWHTDRGWPCPTCGMTTAFTLASQGRLVAAAHAQPAGALAAVVVAMAVWVAGYSLVTGRAATDRLGLLGRPATIVVAAAIVLAAWGYKVVAG